MLSSCFLRLQNSRSVFYESARARFKVLMLARADVDCQLSRATIFNAFPQSCSPCLHSLETFCSPIRLCCFAFLVGIAYIYAFPAVYLFFWMHPLTRRVVVLSFELIGESYIGCYVLASLDFKTAGYFFPKARAAALKQNRRFLQCAGARSELWNKRALQATPLPSLALRIHTRSSLFRPHSPLLRRSVDNCKTTDCFAVYRFLS